MKFVEVEKVPERKRKYKNLKVIFDEFVAMNVKAARVDLTEHDYKNVKVAYTVLHNAAKRFCVPVKVYIRGNEIYFERKDFLN